MRVSNKIWLLASLLCISVVPSSAGAGSLPSAALAASSTFANDLTIGIRGNDVAALQQFLIVGGFLKIPAPTAYFGSLTKTALAAWQASAGVYPAVGFFGPISRARINAIQTQVVVATTSVAVVNNPNPNGSPVNLKIPKLNVNAGFQYTGLKPDGTMEIPSNIVDVGWFTGSVHPGEKGVAVVTGHVAQIRGGVLVKPGVFSNLNELLPGDVMYVLNDKGESVTFVVREIRTYDPLADATGVFRSTDGGAHLNLITCEGTWEPAKLSYTQRLVIFTDAVVPL